MIVPEDCPGVSCDCTPTPPPPSVECDPVLYSDERPSITEETIAWFSSGENFPAGDYKVEYVNGALKYNPSFDWQLNYSAAHGYYITFNGGTSIINAPGDTNAYGTQAALEAANAGQFVTFHHSGGKIGMYLFDDPYGDNLGGDPNPTFRLYKICEIEPPPPPPPPPEDLEITEFVAKLPATGEGLSFGTVVPIFDDEERQIAVNSLLYRVPFRFRGIFEMKDYDILSSPAGLLVGDLLFSNGMLPDGTWNNTGLSIGAGSRNEYWLVITCPYQRIFFNQGAQAADVSIVSILETLSICGNARLILKADSRDGIEYHNVSGEVPAVIGYPVAVSQPWYGSFIQVDALPAVTSPEELEEVHSVSGTFPLGEAVIDFGSEISITGFSMQTTPAIGFTSNSVDLRLSSDGVSYGSPVLSTGVQPIWNAGEFRLFAGISPAPTRYVKINMFLSGGTDFVGTIKFYSNDFSA